MCKCDRSQEQHDLNSRNNSRPKCLWKCGNGREGGGFIFLSFFYSGKMVGVQKSRIAVVALFAHDNSAPFPEEKKNQKEFSRMDSSSKMPVTKRGVFSRICPAKKDWRFAEKGGGGEQQIWTFKFKWGSKYFTLPFCHAHMWATEVSGLPVVRGKKYCVPKSSVHGN